MRVVFGDLPALAPLAGAGTAKTGVAAGCTAAAFPPLAAHFPDGLMFAAAGVVAGFAAAAGCCAADVVAAAGEDAAAAGTRDVGCFWETAMLAATGICSPAFATTPTAADVGKASPGLLVADAGGSLPSAASPSLAFFGGGAETAAGGRVFVGASTNGYLSAS